MKRLLLIIGVFSFSLAAITCILHTQAYAYIEIVTKPGERISLYKDYQALVVGVGEYDCWPDLRGAVKDAREISTTLKEMGMEVATLLNPTSVRLKEALNRLAYGPGQERNRAILFYFSGHGETESLASGEKLGYIVPKDTPLPTKDRIGFINKAISMNQIETYALRIKSKHVLMVFDSCFSGSVFSSVKSAPTDITEKSALHVRQFITAGTENEQVPDESVFSTCFIQGIKGEADYNKDGYVTGSELGLYLDSTVVNYTKGCQHPQYGKIRHPKLDKGDFIFQLEIPEPIIEEKRKARLFIETEPPDANARITNIERDFYQGIELEPGEYHLEVSKEGCEKKFVVVTLSSGEDKNLNLCLECVITALTNSIGMKFVIIHPGTFTMGSPYDEPGRLNDERRHKVTLSKPFYLQTTEVTQAQWQAVMDSNPSTFRDCGDDCPVEGVTWFDCQEFIKRLNRIENTNKYRLPTEAEWEYACRAESKTRFCFGSSKAELGEHAWYRDNSGKRTNPVEQKKANPWGLYDMHGNVWEWCTDWYGEYSDGHVTDPRGPYDGWARLLRGGGCNYYSGFIRSAARGKATPDSRYYNRGLRIAKDY
jgi:formylglycine-generating enzyme required for sulfatase activity